MKAVFVPEARDELFESIDYYEEQASGLGLDFLSDIEEAIQSIKMFPKSSEALDKKFRRKIVKKFPFGIIYTVESDIVYIIAISHLFRFPGYWKERNL